MMMGGYLCPDDGKWLLKHLGVDSHVRMLQYIIIYMMILQTSHVDVT